MDIAQFYDSNAVLMATWQDYGITLERAQDFAATMADDNGNPPAKISLNGVEV
jgi:hypothetical protein